MGQKGRILFLDARLVKVRCDHAGFQIIQLYNPDHSAEVFESPLMAGNEGSQLLVAYHLVISISAVGEHHGENPGFHPCAMVKELAQITVIYLCLLTGRTVDGDIHFLLFERFHPTGYTWIGDLKSLLPFKSLMDKQRTQAFFMITGD